MVNSGRAAVVTMSSLSGVKKSVHSLRHSARISPNPEANLSGWFLRTPQMWTVRRWLELRGAILTYRHAPNSTVQWSTDVRECEICAGRSAKELIIKRDHFDAITLIAPTIQDLKVWFATLKRVSDNIHSFYRLSAQISHVSAGPVVLGRDKATDEGVSVFMLDKRLMTNRSKYLMARRDAGMIRSTQTHESVLSVIDVFETSRAIHVVTELVTGGCLQTLLETNLPLAPMIVRGIAQDLLEALTHLHGLGIIHGNIEAQNIVAIRKKVGETHLRVKLCVFGLANHLYEDDYNGFEWVIRQAIGRAPEVVCFQQRSSASDVFECGVLIFTLLTGLTPFAGRTDTEYLSNVSLGPCGPVWATLGGEVRGLLCGMLQDDPKQRPTAKECLKHEWLAQGDEDESQRAMSANVTFNTREKIEAEFARVASDPKSVIVDFETKPKRDSMDYQSAGCD